MPQTHSDGVFGVPTFVVNRHLSLARASAIIGDRPPSQTQGPAPIDRQMKSASIRDVHSPSSPLPYSTSIIIVIRPLYFFTLQSALNGW